MPDRSQTSFGILDPDSLVPPDHQVRAIWSLLEKLDLAEFYAAIEARGSQPGAPATDPRLLLALWIFANIEGIGSARQLARLCERDAPYRWLCGGVSVNHHTLSDFRVEHGEKLDHLMTQLVGALMHNGIVKLQRVAHDGTKIRASAGASSFRRKHSVRRTLKECRQDAREQIRALREELDESPAASAKREQAAQERALAERQAKLEAALAEIAKMEKKRAASDRQSPSTLKRQGKVRASTTDAECRVMKMADGGFRPAYNVQLATDESGAIVGVDVTNNGTDYPHVKPMLEQIEARTGKTPADYLIDGGFTKIENIEVLSEHGATVYAPVPKPKKKGVNRYAPRRGDSPAVAAWRRRMRTPEAKRIYIQRGTLAERTNADLKAHRGLDRVNVRGLAKVKAVVLLAALAFNVLRLLAA
jgi:transposase